MDETMMIMELVLGFRATKNEYDHHRREWPECEKNKTGPPYNHYTELALDFPSDSDDEHPKRTRSNATGPKDQQPYPSYVIVRNIQGEIPRQLPIYRYQTRLLLSIDKYVKGFFDSEGGGYPKSSLDRSTATARHISAEWAWQTFSIRCQGVLSLVRKPRVVQRLHGSEIIRPSKKREWLTTIASDILGDEVFNKLGSVTEDCNPYILASFWTICRILRALAPQIGYTDGHEPLHLTTFIRELQDPLSRLRDGHGAGLDNLLKSLSKISTVDLRDTMRISCLCTARAFTSRLGEDDPVVLDMWANYHRWWDPQGLDQERFLGSWETALEKTKAKYGANHEATIMTLRGYASSAYFICHQKDLAKKLAEELWERTWGSAASEGADLSTWSVKAQGMAEAAQMMALLECIIHDDKHKGRKAIKIIHRENPMGRTSRRKWLKTQEQPRWENVKPAITLLVKAVETLEGGDENCRMAAAGLSDTLASLLVTLAKKLDEEGKIEHDNQQLEISREYRRRGEEIRAISTSFHLYIQEPATPAAP